MPCTRCGAPVASGASTCSTCGQVRLNRWWTWVRRGTKAGVVLGVALGVWFSEDSGWGTDLFEDAWDDSPAFLISLIALYGGVLGGLIVGLYGDWLHPWLVPDRQGGNRS